MTFLWKKPSSLLNGERDPFYSLQTDINKLFSSFLNDGSERNELSKKLNWQPRVELKETPKDFIFHAELPGCKKEDVHVSLHNNIFTIRGERKSEETRKEEKSHYSERIYGSFERSFGLPENVVDTEKVDAKFQDGVLTVTLPKKTESRTEPKRIEIQ